MGWRDTANHLLEVTKRVTDLAAALDLADLLGSDIDSAARPVAEWLARDALTLSRVPRPPRSEP